MEIFRHGKIVETQSPSSNFKLLASLQLIFCYLYLPSSSFSFITWKQITKEKKKKKHIIFVRIKGFSPPGNQFTRLWTLMTYPAPHVQTHPTPQIQSTPNPNSTIKYLFKSSSYPHSYSHYYNSFLLFKVII